MMRLLYKLSLVLLIGFALFACESSENKTPVEKEIEKNPGFLRLPLEGISTLDPGLTQFNEAIELTEQLFLGLTDFDPKTYQVVPELALNFTANSAGDVYRFNLRQDVKWTDHTPVTAHDIVWAIQRNLRAETDAPAVNTLFLIKNAESFHKGEHQDVSRLGVKAIDDFTVEFQLETPAAYFPALASMWTYRPLPRQTIEKNGKDWTLAKNIVSNGSYQVTKWKKGIELVLEKSLTYFDASNVKIKKIKYLIVPKSTLGLAMYKQNELDMIGGNYLRLPLNEIPNIIHDVVLRRQYHKTPSFCTESYLINTRLPPMDNPLVRKAILSAINHPVLLEFVLKNIHEPAYTFTRPPVFGSVDPKKNIGLRFNKKQARAWLKQAGYTADNPMPTLHLVLNESEVHETIAQAIQTMLKYYLNIKVDIRVVDFNGYLDTLDALEQNKPTPTHFIRLGWCADYPDANNYLLDAFHPKKSPNWVGWDNPKFTQLIEQAQRSNVDKQRIKLYEQAEKILVEDEAVVLPIYFANASYLIKPWVKDWYNMAFGGQHIRNWSLEN